MSDAFEQFVGGILDRIVDKSPHLRAIVGEDEMQAAWTEKKGQKPSVCDWMIFGKGHCIVIDATNHAVKGEAAQGLATWDEYSAEIEEIFTEGKFEQLVSTIDSVKKRGGWDDEKTDTQTMFAPLVVVPDAGVPRAADTIRHRQPGPQGVWTSSTAGVRTRRHSGLMCSCWKGWPTWGRSSRSSGTSPTCFN